MTVSLRKGDINIACKGGLTGLSVYRKVTSILCVQVVWQDYQFTERWCQHCLQGWFDTTLRLQKGDINTVCTGGLTGLSVYRKVMSTLPARVVWHDSQATERVMWCMTEQKAGRDGKGWIDTYGFQVADPKIDVWKYWSLLSLFTDEAKALKVEVTKGKRREKRLENQLKRAEVCISFVLFCCCCPPPPPNSHTHNKSLFIWQLHMKWNMCELCKAIGYIKKFFILKVRIFKM